VRKIGEAFLFRLRYIPGAIPLIVSYNATSSLVRFEKNWLLYIHRYIKTEDSDNQLLRKIELLLQQKVAYVVNIEK
jgi:hypothetical protein